MIDPTSAECRGANGRVTGMPENPRRQTGRRETEKTAPKRTRRPNLGVWRLRRALL